MRLQRSVEEVFAYLSDHTRAPEWIPGLVSVEPLGDGRAGVGARYREVLQMGQSRSTADLEVTEYEPGKVYAHRRRAGPTHVASRYELTPDHGDGEATLLACSYSVHVSGLFRAMSPVMVRRVRKEAEAALENLRRRLEQPSDPAR